MRLAGGVIFGLISAVFLLLAFTAQIGVPTYDEASGVGQVANLSMMHWQMIEIVMGVGAAVISALCLVSIPPDSRQR